MVSSPGIGLDGDTLIRGFQGVDDHIGQHSHETRKKSVLSSVLIVGLTATALIAGDRPFLSSQFTVSAISGQARIPPRGRETAFA
jgi:hypothetical protein